MPDTEATGDQSETKMDILIRKMNNLQTSVDNNNVEMKARFDAVLSSNKALENDVSELRFQNAIKDSKIQHLESRLDISEGRWFENNLLFCGIQEKTSDGNCEALVQNVMTQLGVVSNDRTFISTYRLGKASANRSRPIVARFQYIKDRNIVWAKRRDVKSDHVYIRAMYPPKIYRNRRVLQAINNYAETIPSYKGSVRLTHNHQIQIGRAQYGIHELEKLPIDLQKPVGSHIVGDIHLFFGVESPFSNFYPSEFTIDKLVYSCNEQYYYMSKARHYCDQKAQVQIMATDDPAKIKRIGKAIATGDSEWNKNPDALTAMHKGLHAKFTQNEYLGRVLLNTGEDILAEANPHDSVWGIGLNRYDPKATKKSDWEGENHLGELLMAVRYDLRGQ